MKFAFVKACPNLMTLGGCEKLQAAFGQIQRPHHSDLLSLLKGSGIREWEGPSLPGSFSWLGCLSPLSVSLLQGPFTHITYLTERDWMSSVPARRGRSEG